MLVRRDLGRCWPQMLRIDLLYKAIAFVLLFPVTALLLRIFIRSSGGVLADEDILYFFLGPLGWLCLVVLGAVSLAIVALEQGVLLTVGLGSATEERVAIRNGLVFALKRGGSIVELATHIVLRSLLVSAPFLLAAGFVYTLLLGEHDINFYLTEKPPAFQWAVGLAALLIGGLAACLLILLVRWVFSLPILLFEEATASQALAESANRSRGHRLEVAKWLLIWVGLSLLISFLVSGATGLIGRQVVPVADTSLPILLVAIGSVLLLWGVGNLGSSVLSLMLFALIVLHLWRELGGGRRVELPGEVKASRVVAQGEVFAKRMVGLVLVTALLLAAAIGALLLGGVRLDDDIEVTAHRGGAIQAPENTLAAIELALEQGADWIEIDVQETADGEVIVLHDSDLKKVAGLGLKIWEATLADLETIDIGSWHSPRFSDQRVPTLAQVLEKCKGRAGVNIELKYYGHDQRLEERVVEQVEAAGMAGDVVVMSLKLEGVEKLKALRPEWTVGLLSAVAVGDLTRIGVDFLAVNTKLATRRFIRAAHRQGKQVHVWTLNDAISMSMQIGRGADNLITDDPTLARQVLAQRSEMSSVERLVLGLAVFFGADIDLPSSATDA